MKMKKLSHLLLLSVLIVLNACSSDNDNNSVTAGFEGKLTTANTSFTSTSTTKKNSGDYYYYDTFKDNEGLITFDNYHASYGFAGFTYTNSTDNTTTNSYAPICGKAKIGTTYIAAFSSSYTPANFTINNPTKYSIEGCWIANSTYAYNSMITAMGGTTPFTKGSWYKVTATGYDSNNKSIGATSIYLANYTSNTDLPTKDWIWFDLNSLKNAVTVNFEASSSDAGTYGMNTDANFCLDGITLTEK